MFDGVSFIFHRFYSFLSGCIFNFYIMSIYYTMKGIKLKQIDSVFTAFWDLFSEVKIIIENNIVIVFILFAILFGLIIQGINSCGRDLYYDRKNSYDKKNENDVISKILHAVFITHTIVKAYNKCKTKYEGKCLGFISIGSVKKDQHDNVLELDVNAMRAARVHDYDNIYRFRDLSWITQILRLTFFHISIFSLTFTIVSALLLLYHTTDIRFVVFNFISFALSMLLFLLLTPIARQFSYRYVSNVRACCLEIEYYNNNPFNKEK